MTPLALHIKDTVIKAFIAVNEARWRGCTNLLYPLDTYLRKPMRMTVTAKHMDEIEWGVYKIAPDGSKVRHSEGAQTVFGLTRARKVLKELGEGWVVLHTSTGDPPPD